MDVYILDDQLRRELVIDRYISMIWTERFQEHGDFELQVHSTPKTRALFQKGLRLAIPFSNRIMVIEDYENKEDADGRYVLTLSGRSLEACLLSRVARNTTGSLTANPKWTITDTPGNVARKLFTDICVTGVLRTQDKLPFYQSGTLYPVDTIAEYSEAVTLDIEPKPLYDAIKDICVSYDLGFRMYKGPDTSKLYFNIYAGNNRTTLQTALNPIVFSPELENLHDVTEFSSTRDYKNVAYVASPNGFRIVYGADADSTVSGFDNRVLWVDANDIDLPAGTALQEALEQRGLEQLAFNKSVEAIDGSVPTQSGFSYGVDYDLGDLVEMRNSDGVTTTMRVTEQIFVSDAEGFKSYPTLSNNMFITPGSWYSFEWNINWDDAGEVTWNGA
jgi:hypothetical protein